MPKPLSEETIGKAEKIISFFTIPHPFHDWLNKEKIGKQAQLIAFLIGTFRLGVADVTGTSAAQKGSESLVLARLLKDTDVAFQKYCDPTQNILSLCVDDLMDVRSLLTPKIGEQFSRFVGHALKGLGQTSDPDVVGETAMLRTMDDILQEAAHSTTAQDTQARNASLAMASVPMNRLLRAKLLGGCFEA